MNLAQEKNVERVKIKDHSNSKTIRYFFLFIDVAYNFDSDDGNACVNDLIFSVFMKLYNLFSMILIRTIFVLLLLQTRAK